LEVYPDVVETLAKLKAKGTKLGIVTNGTSRDFQQILSGLDLKDWFGVVVGVDACRKAKPDAEIFRYALNKLNVQPEEALFIGDSVQYDFEGARRAGLRPLLINRNGKAQARAETVRSLTEVLAYV
jgi:putative hydrolase of the HAD superfamily